MMRSVCVMTVALACVSPAARADDAYSLLGKKEVRYLSLDEARAIALDRGPVGLSSLLFPSANVEKAKRTSLQVYACSGASSSELLAVYSVVPKSPTTRAEVERTVNQMLLNIETAYWNLYGSYWNLHSREQALRFSFEAWRIVKSQFDAGSKNVGDLGQARGQYELFRTQRLQALDTVLDNERQLRALMDLPIEDGTRLVPCDVPSLAVYKPDFKTSLQEALARRPELILTRREVKANKLLLKYGKAERHAEIKQQLARSRDLLQNQELKTERFLGLQFRRLASYYEQIRAQRAQREAYGEQLKARFQDFLAERKTLDILLEAQRFWADALANEYAAIVSYNNALCAFAYAKGTILEHAHITLTNSPPADSCRVPAVACEQDRTQAQILAVKPAPTCSFLNVSIPDRLEEAYSVPALWKSIPPLKKVGTDRPIALKSEDLFPVEAGTE